MQIVQLVLAIKGSCSSELSVAPKGPDTCIKHIKERRDACWIQSQRRSSSSGEWQEMMTQDLEMNGIGQACSKPRLEL
jgi:hypothetical protein